MTLPLIYVSLARVSHMAHVAALEMGGVVLASGHHVLN